MPGSGAAAESIAWQVLIADTLLLTVGVLDLGVARSLFLLRATAMRFALGSSLVCALGILVVCVSIATNAGIPYTPLAAFLLPVSGLAAFSVRGKGMLRQMQPVRRTPMCNDSCSAANRA